MKWRYFALCLLPVSSFAHQKIVIGTTWEIKEPNPIVEIKRRIENMDPAKLEPKHSYRTRLAASNVNRVIEPQKRLVTPSYTLERNIYDKNGSVLYPAGFTFNFLEYTPFNSQRIVIIDESDAEQIADTVKAKDIIIVRHGDLQKVSNTLSTHATMLDKLTAERLQLAKVPVLIYREQNHFVHQEFLPEQGVPQ